MVELSVADIEQLYYKSLILYKGKPAKVLSINRDKTVMLTILASQRKVVVPFIQDDFKPVLGRIGFVNHGGFAFYVQRMPVRRYNIGLTQQNTVVRGISRHHPEAFRAYDAVAALNTKSICQALDNDYPTLQSAIKAAKEREGSVAFDKQFAVDHMRNIYFKATKVGAIPLRYSARNRIRFEPEYEFLEILVEPHYEKTVRTFEPA